MKVITNYPVIINDDKIDPIDWYLNFEDDEHSELFGSKASRRAKRRRRKSTRGSRKRQRQSRGSFGERLGRGIRQVGDVLGQASGAVQGSGIGRPRPTRGPMMDPMMTDPMMTNPMMTDPTMNAMNLNANLGNSNLGGGMKKSTKMMLIVGGALIAGTVAYMVLRKK
jgi:hypothetical protein